jgi:hypothetical protein
MSLAAANEVFGAYPPAPQATAAGAGSELVRRLQDP